MVWFVCICLNNAYFHMNIVLKFAFTDLPWQPFPVTTLRSTSVFSLRSGPGTAGP